MWKKDMDSIHGLIIKNLKKIKIFLNFIKYFTCFSCHISIRV
jgi:hypothetical protein